MFDPVLGRAFTRFYNVYASGIDRKLLSHSIGNHIKSNEWMRLILTQFVAKQQNKGKHIPNMKRETRNNKYKKIK